LRREGVTERRDHSVLGYGAEHALPDYRVKLLVAGKFLRRDLGTVLNRSATNWIEFPVRDMIWLKALQEIGVSENDRVEDDLLENLLVNGRTGAGRQFEYRLSTERTLGAAVEWFFDLAPGRAITTGFIVAIVVLFLAARGRVGV
jgi:hypothetical protein